MLANTSSLLTLNPIIVNLELGLYGLLFAALFLYVRGRFRKSARLLHELQADWAKAELAHAELLEAVRGKLTHLTVETRSTSSYTADAAPIAANVRDQVTAMGRSGIAADEIARSCGLPEGEVQVLLGMARLLRAEA